MLRLNCVVGSACEINFFTHKIEKFCVTLPAMKLFCFDSETGTGGQASCLTRPAGFQPPGYAEQDACPPSRWLPPSDCTAFDPAAIHAPCASAISSPKP